MGRIPFQGGDDFAQKALATLAVASALALLL